MSKEEFDLSEKIQHNVLGYDRLDAIAAKKVKEFIRRIKEEIRTCWMKSVEKSDVHFYLEIIERELDRLAGERLK